MAPQSPSEVDVLAAFGFALETRRYPQLLRRAGVDPREVGSMPDFLERVPHISKEDLFRPDIPLHHLCRGGSLADIGAVTISSGSSGLSAFGVVTRAEEEETATGVDAGLDALFSAASRRTLLINAFAMGIQIPTSHAVAATGVRSDLVLQVLQKAGGYCDQSVILADPHFLKRIVDEGNEQGVDWSGLRVSFVSGQDWLAETLRAHIQSETGIEPDSPSETRAFFQTMGMTELGLNVFFETPQLARARRWLLGAPHARVRLTGGSGNATPSLFHYDPKRFFLESRRTALGAELVATTLSEKKRIPLIRYATGDQVTLHAAEEMAGLLEDYGRPDLAPGVDLPVAAVWGRAASPGGNVARVEEMREGLFADPMAAASVTGHFTIVQGAGQAHVAVQLREGVIPAPQLERRVGDALFSRSPHGLPARLYRAGEYPFARVLDFERKFAHSAGSLGG